MDPNDIQVSFEDYVAMSACVPVFGFEGMLANYKLSSAQWTQIAGHWNGLIPTNPQYSGYAMLVQQETARIRAGGQPRPVNIGAPPAPGVAPPQPQGYPPQQGYNAYAQQQPYNPNAQQFGRDVGNAFNAFGNALGSFVDGAVAAFSPGARVTVQWSDGNRYPGTVMQAANGQIQVAFPNGQQVWVPQHAVTLG